MNAGKQPILIIKQDCSRTVNQLTDQLTAVGYSVMRSFDLLSALTKYSNCFCRRVILLVYPQDDLPPATLVIDGDDNFTSVFLDYDLKRSHQSRFIVFLSQLPAVSYPLEDQNKEVMK
ncbi:MAG: hypothetical protein FD147_512 [Chloroflexi bacterium]|nr:MAG: hypothetical protein FD147_512 [Chloroflexota bacterium]MBA4376129.1 hypothetical protein [Anaerolinea sp.]